MLTLIGNVLEGLLVLILFAAVVLFRLTARSFRYRQEGESQQELFARLWKAYRANVVRTLASPWFWGAVGLVTAALIYFNRPIFNGL
jgi:hypothetical protein